MVASLERHGGYRGNRLRDHHRTDHQIAVDKTLCSQVVQGRREHQDDDGFRSREQTEFMVTDNVMDVGIFINGRAGIKSSKDTVFDLIASV